MIDYFYIIAHHFSGSGDCVPLSSASGRAKNHMTPNPDYTAGAALLRLGTVRVNLEPGALCKAEHYHDAESVSLKCRRFW